MASGRKKRLYGGSLRAGPSAEAAALGRVALGFGKEKVDEITEKRRELWRAQSKGLFVWCHLQPAGFTSTSSDFASSSTHCDIGITLTKSEWDLLVSFKLRLKLFCIKRFEDVKLDCDDVAAVVETLGWKAVYPARLKDGHLLRLAEQLHSLDALDISDEVEESASAALLIAMVLASGVCEEHFLYPGDLDVPEWLVNPVLSALAMAVDNEVVRRIVGANQSSFEQGLVDVIKSLALGHDSASM